MPSIDFGYIGGTLLLLVGLYLVSALFSYLQQYIMAGVAQNIVYDMRRDVNDKLARLPLKYFDSKTHGEIMSRVTNDIDNISTTLQQSLTQLITSVCTIVGVLVMMLTISPWLTLISPGHPARSPSSPRSNITKVPEELRRAAEGARRAQRPRRGDVHGAT